MMINIYQEGCIVCRYECLLICYSPTKSRPNRLPSKEDTEEVVRHKSLQDHLQVGSMTPEAEQPPHPRHSENRKNLVDHLAVGSLTPNSVQHNPRLDDQSAFHSSYH